MTCRLLYIRRGTTADRCPTQPTIFTYRISWSLWPAAMADFMACDAATLNPLEAASSQHHGLRRIRLVWLKSVGGMNSCYYSNHGVNGGLLYAVVIRKLLGLWRGYDPSECTGAIHTPLATPNPLGLVKIRRGDE